MVASVNPPATPTIKALRKAGATRLNGVWVASGAGVVCGGEIIWLPGKSSTCEKGKLDGGSPLHPVRPARSHLVWDMWNYSTLSTPMAPFIASEKEWVTKGYVPASGTENSSTAPPPGGTVTVCWPTVLLAGLPSA